MIKCLIFAFFIVPVAAHCAEAIAPSWDVIAAKLNHAGFKDQFVQELKSSFQEKNFRETLELNTLLFLRRSDYHGIQVTPLAATAVRQFEALNADALRQAQATYGVPGEIVASLLWLESRHGQNEGRFRVPSVFASLLLADQPANLQHLYAAARHFTPHVTKAKRRAIASRAHKRVKWALAELKAIEKMWTADPQVFKHLKGSFAGAFGMPQFEPSSYVEYAKAFKPDHPADLESAADAISSVAYYLKTNGWKATRRSQMRALMKYNNSHDYAAAILKLAELSRHRDERAPSGKQEL